MVLSAVDLWKTIWNSFDLKGELMKPMRIDLKKLHPKSKQPKEFSEALVGAKKGHEGKRDFTKTFVASGKPPAGRL